MRCMNIPLRPGSVEKPVERVAVPVGNLPEPEVVALLSPFMYPTPHAIANNMLFLYIKYHMVLGIRRYVQYTQVRPAVACPHPTSLRPGPALFHEVGMVCHCCVQCAMLAMQA